MHRILIFLWVALAGAVAQPAEQPAVPADGGLTLALPPRWDRPVLGGSPEAAQEFLSIIGGYTKPDPSPVIERNSEIYGGVTLMMPLKEALVKLNIYNHIVPQKQPIAFPGIPFFYRIFKSPTVIDSRRFNLIYIITDMEDRVVALQFVEESPDVPYWNTQSGGRYYNFINNRSKAVRKLTVGVELKQYPGSNSPYSLQELEYLKREAESSKEKIAKGNPNSSMREAIAKYEKALDGGLIIRTYLVDSEKRPSPAALEITELRLPRKIADLLNYSMQQRIQGTASR